jgi:hypothetical protein
VAVVVASGLLVVLAGCSDSSSPTAAAGPTARTAAAEGALGSAARAPIPPTRYLLMRDDCEATSFNATFGAGICIGRGRTAATAFLAELAQTRTARRWVFVPPNASIPRATRVVASNIGGEDHTFTPVREFGGGIIPPLNDLARTPTVAPECQSLEDDDFVPSDKAYTVKREVVAHDGLVKVQCCIHPWMRATISVGGTR